VGKGLVDHIVEVREYSVEKPKIVLIRSKTLGEDFLKAQKNRTRVQHVPN